MTLAPKWITPAGTIGTFPQGKNATFVLETIGSKDFDLVAGDVTSIGYFSFIINTLVFIILSLKYTQMIYTLLELNKLTYTLSYKYFDC
jgi:hypothetical protein